MPPLICVRVLISADSVCTLMEPQWIQTCAAADPTLKTNVEDLPDTVILAQSKPIWL